VSALLGACLCAVNARADAPLLQEIQRAWQARQDRFPSVVLRWEQEEHYAAGAFLNKDEVSVTRKMEFVFDGERCSFVADGPRWTSETRAFNHETFRVTVNGADVKMLFSGEAFGNHASGFICGHTTMTVGSDYNREPPIVTFRPTAPNMTWFSIPDWSVSSPREVLNGHECVKLEIRPHEWSRENLWLAREVDFLPVRHEWFERERFLKRLDTEYVDRADVGPVPQNWRCIEVFRESDKLRWVLTANVAELKLNVAMPAGQFDIEFPPGTTVGDEKAGRISVVRKDGTWRPIDREEFATMSSYDELMETDPPSLIARRKAVWRWSLIGAGAVICAIGALWLRRRAG
jgi:hypothetical protein